VETVLTPEKNIVLIGYFLKRSVLIRKKSANLAGLQQPRKTGRAFGHL
jgi:hypothetical protein